VSAATPQESTAPQKPSYKGWAGIRRAFGTPSALTLAVLGFGSGLPFLAIASLTLATRLWPRACATPGWTCTALA